MDPASQNMRTVKHTGLCIVSASDEPVEAKAAKEFAPFFSLFCGRRVRTRLVLQSLAMGKSYKMVSQSLIQSEYYSIPHTHIVQNSTLYNLPQRELPRQEPFPPSRLLKRLKSPSRASPHPRFPVSDPAGAHTQPSDYATPRAPRTGPGTRAGPAVRRTRLPPLGSC